MMQFFTDKVLVFLIIISVVECEASEIQTFTAHEGGKVEIRCSYESRYKEHVKYLCKGKCQIGFKDKPVQSESKPTDGRFSLHDNSTAHIFTVTITDLRSSDEGTYWCAIETGFGRFDDYTKVHLKITQDNGSITSTTTKTTISLTQSPSSHYTVNTDTMTSSSSSSRFYPVPKDLKSDMMMIISLSVTLMLLLVGLSLFMYCRQRNKTKDSSLINNDTLQEHAENNMYVIFANEELYDVTNHQDFCSCSSCVQVNSNLPTNSSETARTVYAMIQSPTNSSETDRTIYSLAQLPTNS